MKLDFKNSKITICGLQDSGKTFFAKHLAEKQFKRPAWIFYNKDDLKDIPKNILPILMDTGTTEELNEIIGHLIKLAEQKKIDAIFIDEIDLFITPTTDIKKYFHINNLFVNHRHFNQDKKFPRGNLAVVGITRRPQDTGAKYVESCKYVIVFALPQSDNVRRKFRGIDDDLSEMVKSLKMDEYKFIIMKTGERPKKYNAIPLKAKANEKLSVTESKKLNGDTNEKNGF